MLAGMATVSFYHLKTPQQLGKLRLVCQLAGTAFRKGHKVYISALDEAQCEQLDQLLWTFAANSFIPHVSLLNNRNPDLDKFPVVIGYKEPAEKFNDVLISLQPVIQPYAQQFQRVVEPVDANSQDEEQAKVKFEQYRSAFETEPNSYFI